MEEKLDVNRLITLVKDHAALYDYQNAEYSDSALRESHWKKIGYILKKPPGECKLRWNRVRENFRKAIFLRRSKGDPTCKKKPPRYYKELSFLLPLLKEDEGTNKTPASVPEGTSCNEDDNVDVSFSHYMDIKASPRSPDFQDELSHEDPMVIEPSAFTNDTRAFNVTQDTSDTLTEFFLNMAKTVKTFPKQEQILVKAKVFKLVNDIEVKLAS